MKQPGLFTSGTEFVATPDGNRVFHDKIETTFDSLPEYVYKTIRRKMGDLNAGIDEMLQFAFKYWGGNDDKVDIDENGNPSGPEYLEGHSPAYFPNGECVSAAHLRVIKELDLDDSIKIGEKVFISEKTVANHLQAMYRLTGFKNRTQLALWAKNQGII